MVLFVSRASARSYSGSDVDLLVEFLPGARVGLLEMGGLKEDLEERLGCTVDLVSRAAVERSSGCIIWILPPSMLTVFWLIALVANTA